MFPGDTSIQAVSTGPDPDETDQRPGMTTTTRPYCPAQQKRNRLQLRPVWALAEAALARSVVESTLPRVTQLDADNPTASST